MKQNITLEEKEQVKINKINQSLSQLFNLLDAIVLEPFSKPATEKHLVVARAKQQIEALEKLIAISKANFKKDYNTTLAIEIAKRANWDLIIASEHTFEQFKKQFPEFADRVNKIIKLLSGKPIITSVQFEPKTILDSKYVKNLSVTTVPHTISATQQLIQLLSIWQSLSYNEFVYPLAELSPFIGNFNQIAYINFLRSYPMQNAQLYTILSKKVLDENDFITRTQTIGGRDNSCGYHALRNAILIARAAFTAKSNQAGEVEKILNLSDMLKLFGTQGSNGAVFGDEKDGIWRNIIQKKRYRDAAQFEIEEKLILLNKFLAPKPAEFAKEIDVSVYEDILWNIYKVILNDYKNYLIQDVLHKNLVFDNLPKFILVMKIIRDNVVSFIKNYSQVPRVEIDPEFFPFIQQQVMQEFKSDGNINRFIQNYFIDLNIIVNTEKDWEDVAEKIRFSRDELFELNGDWLHQEEIELLLQQEKKSGGLLENLTLVDITFVNNTAEVDPTTSPELSVLARLVGFKKRHNDLHIFILKSDGEIGSGKHWITMIAQKINGKITYIILDSENIARYDNKVVEAIINATK